MCSFSVFRSSANPVLRLLFLFWFSQCNLFVVHAFWLPPAIKSTAVSHDESSYSRGGGVSTTTERREVVCFSASTTSTSETRETRKEELMQLIASTPSNGPTPMDQTKAIQAAVKALEFCCPTADEDVVSQLAGNWELLWTAQDTSSLEWQTNLPFQNFINPLENQSYSNNPSGGGRANPFLPRPVQDRLEQMGIVRSATSSSSEQEFARSSQSIDIVRQQVRNVVTFQLPQTKQKVVVIVTIGLPQKQLPDPSDPRKVGVKFQSCRVIVSDTKINFWIPLGFIGPTGWLRTGYIDDTLRITRGNKGSIFILIRTAATRNNA